MSHDPNGRIDRDLAERLLRGDPVGPDGLADLLAAAGAPVSTGPLPGEEQALAAFQRGGATPASRPRRRIMIKLALAQLIATKAFAATAAAAAVGGVAVAAATGTLPLPGHHDGTVQSGPVAGGETSHSEQPSGDGGTSSERPSTRPSEPGQHTTPSANPSGHPSEHPSSTPTESHAPAPVSYGDLCRGLLSGHGGEVSVKLTWPQYAPLLAKGGGTKSGAVEYCVQLLGLSPTPSEHPSPTSSETHSPTPTPNPSETHSPTPTPNPSETHSPTAAPTSSQL